MNKRFSIQLPEITSNEFQNAFENCVHEYLDDREGLLFEKLDLDLEIMREVTALDRVLRRLTGRDSVHPMPDIIKRIFYLKRDIYHEHRPYLEFQKYSSRRYLR